MHLVCRHLIGIFEWWTGSFYKRHKQEIIINGICAQNPSLQAVFAYDLDHTATGLDRPLGLQEVRLPEFLDNRRLKAVCLSAICTGGFCLPGTVPGTHFC